MSDAESEALFQWLDLVRDGKQIPLNIATAMHELKLIEPQTGGGWKLSQQGSEIWHKLA